MAAAIRALKMKAAEKRREKRLAASEEEGEEGEEAGTHQDDPFHEEAGTHQDAPTKTSTKEVAVEVPSDEDEEPEEKPPSWPLKGRFWIFQPQMRNWYESSSSQVSVAVLIMFNFLTNVTEKEIDPQGVLHPHMWRAFEHSFNSVFLLELLINMYSRWLRDFWCDGWNIFDLIVVSVGCISFFVELDGPLKLLRCLRAFRVFRLFKRVKSLNRIIVMIIAAIPGVTNAFLVIVIMISIYSLVAVEFFSTFGTVRTSEYTTLYEPNANVTYVGAWDPTISIQEIQGTETIVHANIGTGTDSNAYVSNVTHRTPEPQCAYINSVGGVVNAVTSRDICFGSEYWGTFTRAWYTLFQILTGESWSEAIARPVLFGWDDYGSISIYISSLFFISFVLINAFILFNVFVAVLLDKVIQPEEEEDELADPEPKKKGASKDKSADKAKGSKSKDKDSNGITLYPWASGPMFSDRPTGHAPAEEHAGPADGSPRRSSTTSPSTPNPITSAEIQAARDVSPLSVGRLRRAWGCWVRLQAVREERSES